MANPLLQMFSEFLPKARARLRALANCVENIRFNTRAPSAARSRAFVENLPTQYLTKEI
jgi:hypothetical protein